MKLKLTKKDIKHEIFGNYFKHESPSSLRKHLLEAKQAKNQQLVKNIKDALINLRKAVIRKSIPENEKP